MRWTGWIAIAGGLLALVGCGYGYRTIVFQGRYSMASRPDASYFCYDCHGYRYFDPYYDYCDGQGFRYRWADHPRAMIVYRDRYVRIKEAHPDYGRYRYRSGYKSAERYRDPRDYESWRREVKSGPAAEAKQGRERKVREKDMQEPGKKKERKGEKRKGPRDDGSRLTLPGGVS
jgi:hypothetical protein